MATFGQYVVLTTDLNAPADYANACQFTMNAENGTLTHLGMWIRTGSGGDKMKLCMWADDSDYPAALLDYTAEHTTVENSRNEVAVTNGYNLIANTKYWLGWINDSIIWGKRETTGGAVKYKVYEYDLGVPNPFPAAASSASWLVTIYGIYTAAGALSIPVAMHHYGHHIGKIIRG